MKGLQKASLEEKYEEMGEKFLPVSLFSIHLLGPLTTAFRQRSDMAVECDDRVCAHYILRRTKIKCFLNGGSIRAELPEV